MWQYLMKWHYLMNFDVVGLFTITYFIFLVVYLTGATSKKRKDCIDQKVGGGDRYFMINGPLELDKHRWQGRSAVNKGGVEVLLPSQQFYTCCTIKTKMTTHWQELGASGMTTYHRHRWPPVRPNRGTDCKQTTAARWGDWWKGLVVWATAGGQSNKPTREGRVQVPRYYLPYVFE